MVCCEIAKGILEIVVEIPVRFPANVNTPQNNDSKNKMGSSIYKL